MLILHEATYFIVKCLFKLWQEFFHLLLRPCFIQRIDNLVQAGRNKITKTASTNVTNLYFQTFGSFAFLYVNSNTHYSFVLYSMGFCNWFIFKYFVFIQVFDFSKYYLLTCSFHCIDNFCIEFRFCETFKIIIIPLWNFQNHNDSVTRISMIEILYKLRTIKC